MELKEEQESETKTPCVHVLGHVYKPYQGDMMDKRCIYCLKKLKEN